LNQRLAELKRKKLHADIVEFYEFLENRVMVHFKPRHNAMASIIEFSLVLSEKSTYDQMAKEVSTKLNHSPEHIRFTGSLKGIPESVIHRQRVLSTSRSITQEFITVADMIKSAKDDSSYSSSKWNNILFYELLDLPTGDAEQKRMVKVTWTGADDREEVGSKMLSVHSCLEIM
jgi:ubiquitin carboxyl-terminal hydrolase 7